MDTRLKLALGSTWLLTWIKSLLYFKVLERFLSIYCTISLKIRINFLHQLMLFYNPLQKCYINSIILQKANAYMSLGVSEICARDMRTVRRAAPACWSPRRERGGVSRAWNREDPRRCWRVYSERRRGNRWAASAAAAATARWSSESA